MNLNDSIDEATNDYSSYWQSIPDPPTPGKAAAAAPETNDDNPAAEKRRKRRQSALKDRTNRNDAAGTDLKKRSSGSAEDDDEFAGLFSEDDAIMNSRKRSSKKRRSLLLPSDDKVDVLDYLSSRDDSAESKYAVDNSASLDITLPSNIQNNKPSNQEIINLVRQYCALPPNQRQKSIEASQIESLTTYPMPGKILKFANTETCKREFILRAKPIVVLMEEQKQRDIVDARNFTRCEVKRVRGGFEYVDLESGKGVDAEEYRKRYCAMLDERKTDRLGRRTDGEDVTGSLNDTSPFADDSNMDMDESVFSPDDSCLNGAEASDGRIAISSSSNTPTISSSATTGLVNDTAETCSNDTADQKSCTEIDTTIGNAAPSSASKETAPHPFIGSLPPSNDPRVLEARRKLFCAIDTALATYSREIMALAQENESTE